MPLTKWLNCEVKNLKNVEKRSVIIKFWDTFYNHARDLVLNNYMYKKSSTLMYKDEVFSILNSAKCLNLTEDNLLNLKFQIEDLTMSFDEKSMFKTTSNIIKMLICVDKENARDYLSKKVTSDIHKKLLMEFGQYTIEALIVYVLCMLFSSSDSNTMIRVASLVEQLERNVEQQAKILRKRRKRLEEKAEEEEELPVKVDVKKSGKLEKRFPIGTGLVEFMEERGMITLVSDIGGSVRVAKKKESYYLPSALYVLCNFDISLLPIKLNLPMVCPPLKWKSAKGDSPRTLSDLTGGYLSSPTSEIYDRYRLLSSHNEYAFYLDIENPTNLCDIMNKLQSQPFKINKAWMDYISCNYDHFVDNGLLMPKFIANLNIKYVSDKLRELYMMDETIKKEYSYNELLIVLQKDIQRARYEHLIFSLAKAYEGYEFYLPAFVDFRGRIYRSGVLHFHERDLARSLLLFANPSSSFSNANIWRVSVIATSFHYKPFLSEEEALMWYKEFALNIQYVSDDVGDDGTVLIKAAADAKRPFQFLSNLLNINLGNTDLVQCIPITQDASASAYQIMSYFLLDERIAKRTNLIQSPHGEIQDLYSYIQEELKFFLKEELMESNLATIVCSELTRKMVKGIFMPIIYGKTVMSTANDIKGYLSQYLTHKECFDVAKACFMFWKIRYHNMDCLIRLIRCIGWVASSCRRPVQYKVDYYSTIQEYKKMDTLNIWVYDRLHKKRRQVSLRVPSDKWDSKKTEISTFVNFIHQRDANIAMKVVENMLYINAPVYTVHDNFITVPSHCERVAKFYSNAIRDMGPPLSIINEFIYLNVIKPIVDRSIIDKKESFTNMVIPQEILLHFLKSNIPENLVRSKRQIWEERINTILTSYENYTRLVCGEYKNPKRGFDAHLEKFQKFDQQLQGKADVPINCVHY